MTHGDAFISRQSTHCALWGEKIWKFTHPQTRRTSLHIPDAPHISAYPQTRRTSLHIPRRGGTGPTLVCLTCAGVHHRRGDQGPRRGGPKHAVFREGRPSCSLSLVLSL